MGTSMAFYNIMNTGFTREDLVERMKNISDFSKSKTRDHKKLLEQFMSPEMIQQLHAAVAENSAHFSTIFGQKPRENRPVIGYGETARWLPLFEEHLCEGHVPSDDDLKCLYKIFGAPVLAFSIYDSDVLFVSYIDNKQYIHNYANPNFDEFEEYDAEIYSKDFPVFLLDFCIESRHEQLRCIWAKDDYIFADDRMADICELLDIATLHDSSEMPDRYQPIFTE